MWWTWMRGTKTSQGMREAEFTDNRTWNSSLKGTKNMYSRSSSTCSLVSSVDKRHGFEQAQWPWQSCLILGVPRYWNVPPQEILQSSDVRYRIIIIIIIIIDTNKNKARYKAQEKNKTRGRTRNRKRINHGTRKGQNIMEGKTQAKKGLNKAKTQTKKKPDKLLLLLLFFFFLCHNNNNNNNNKTRAGTKQIEQ